jgi:HlyD family secretion protein
MRRAQARGLIVALALVAAVAALILATRPDPVAVVTASVERGTVERSVANTRAGTVEACRRAKLAPSMGGQIVALNVREGDTVVCGDLLLELWNDDLKAGLALARSEAQAAEARAEASCAEADVADREAQRLSKLRRDGLSSEEQTDRAVTTAAARRAQCRATQAQIGIARAQVDAALAALVRTRLFAPFDGIVAEVNGELFEYATPSPIGIATPPAIDLIDTSCYYVSAPIDEVDAPQVEVGMPVRITLDAFGKEAFPGTVRRIAAYVLDLEKQARTVAVEAELDDPDSVQRLLAGYSADIEVILEVREDTLWIPSEALIDGRRVFVLDTETGTLQAREIETGIANWDRTEVLSGLGEGEQVVTSIDREGVEDGAEAVLDTEPE